MFEVGEGELMGLDLVFEVMEKLQLIFSSIKTTKIHQKSYANSWTRDIVTLPKLGPCHNGHPKSNQDRGLPPLPNPISKHLPKSDEFLTYDQITFCTILDSGFQTLGYVKKRDQPKQVQPPNTKPMTIPKLKQ